MKSYRFRRLSKMTKHVTSSEIRSSFSAAMSAMYRTEVPAYGTLMDLVARVNDEALSAEPELKTRLQARTKKRA